MAIDDEDMTTKVVAQRSIIQSPNQSGLDDGYAAPRQQPPRWSTMRQPAQTGLETREQEGDAGSSGGESGGMGEAGLHEEISGGVGEGGESGEESAEASAEQLASAASGESAESDLRGIEGYAPSESSEAAGEAFQSLAEAGSAIEGGAENGNAEFLPFLAALVPTLISSVGPMIAKGVMSRLSPTAARAVKRVAGPAMGAMGSPFGGMLTGLAGRGRAGPGANIQTILQMLLQALNRGGGESGEAGEADPLHEATIEQAVAAIEVIIGDDDRVRINGTTQVPWRRFCALRMTFPSGRTYRGTGWFVGPRAVVTAGHCVYLHAQGGWAQKMEVIPGMNGTSRPYGSAQAVSQRSVGGWVNGKKPESDYGCVVLPAGAFGGRNLGRFGFAALPTATLLARPAILAGYPGDKPFAELWGMKRAIKSVTAKTLVYDIDTMGGQSGAPVYIKRNGVRYVVGIHNYGASSGNSATRVTEAVYRRLLAWSQIS